MQKQKGKEKKPAGSSQLMLLKICIKSIFLSTKLGKKMEILLTDVSRMKPLSAEKQALNLSLFT